MKAGPWTDRKHYVLVVSFPGNPQEWRFPELRRYEQGGDV